MVSHCHNSGVAFRVIEREKAELSMTGIAKSLCLTNKNRFTFLLLQQMATIKV